MTTRRVRGLHLDEVEGAGVAVVLLHGQPGLGRDWSAVTALLGGRFRVIVPDRPGYGDTGGAALGMFANAALMVSVLDDLGIERAIVAGHSFGGGIALALAERYPDRVAGLVPVASVGGPSSLSAFDRLLAMPGVGPWLAFVGFRYLGRLLRAQLTLRGATPLGAGLPPEAIDERVARWRRDAVWTPFAAEQRSFVAELPDLIAGLGAIEASTVLVAARSDTVVPRRATDELASAIPGARVAWVDGGHLVPVEHPQAVADAIAAVAG